MTIRRRASITREGYYYLFILAFIAGGAVMRQINPLFALAGLMLAPMIFNWRIAISEIRNLRVTRRLPRVSAGETLVVDLEVANDRASSAAWQVRVQDRIARVGAARSEVEMLEVIVPQVPPRGTARVGYRCRIYERGEYQVGPAIVGTGFPFGLIKAQRRLSVSQRLLVTPRLGRLGDAWRRYVREDRTGTQGPSHRRGAVDGDFFALRTYRSGDPPRSIHWRSSARLGQLMVKQVEQHSDRQITLLIDLWRPDAPTAEDWLAVEITCCFVATAMTDLCKAHGGRVTLSIAAQEPFHFSGGVSPALRNTALDFLATATATPQTDPFEHWLESGAGGGGGSVDAAMLISTRPTDRLDEIADSQLPDWTARIPRVSVRSPEFARWFRLTERTPMSNSQTETLDQNGTQSSLASLATNEATNDSALSAASGG